MYGEEESFPLPVPAQSIPTADTKYTKTPSSRREGPKTRLLDEIPRVRTTKEIQEEKRRKEEEATSFEWDYYVMDEEAPTEVHILFDCC